jgi:hypothetical protein
MVGWEKDRKCPRRRKWTLSIGGTAQPELAGMIRDKRNRPRFWTRQKQVEVIH